MTRMFTNWREDAACADENPELFFPVGVGERAERQIAEAKQVCEICPVVHRCAEFALRNGYEGVWGGLDDAERRAIRHARRNGASRAG